MKSTKNNNLKPLALLALFITSYIPLFVLIIIRQVSGNWQYMHWGGLNLASFLVFVQKFGVSTLLFVISVLGYGGFRILMNVIESRLANGRIVRIVNLKNNNSEALGYIATYILPFIGSNFNDWIDCVVFLLLIIWVYLIYIRSNMILVNPIISMRYSLLEVEYMDNGLLRNTTMITPLKDLEENVDYKIYKIGFKLHYGKIC